jgi:hypothetical protein
VDGQPLRFLHFSGFNPATPDVLSKYAGVPARVEPCRSPTLARLCDEYASRLADAGLPPVTSAPPVPELVDGILLTQPVRGALRAALIEAELRGSAPVADPRQADAVRAWLRSPVTPGGTSRYLSGLRTSQPTLRTAFAQVPGPDESRYLSWAVSEGVALGLVPRGLATATAPVRLDGARAFVAFVDAAELFGDPTLLAGFGDWFHAADDMTLLIRAPGHDADELARKLLPLLAYLGLDGPDSPDMLVSVDPVEPSALALLVHAALTRRSVDPGFALVPRVADAAALRSLAESSMCGRLDPALAD